MPTEISSSSQDLYCIACGYNQRGISADRCPECGRLYSQTPPSPTRIPWIHRRHVGRLGAYWRTVGMVLLHRKLFCEEMAHPAGYRDARLFWLFTILHAFLPIPIATAIIYLTGTSGGPGANPLLTPYYIPIPPVVSLYLGVLLFIAAASGAPSYFCHPKRLSIRQQNRAVALSYYASAALALAPLIVLCFLAAILLSDRADPIAASLAIGGALAAVLLLAVWFFDTLAIVCAVAGRHGWSRAGVAALLAACWVVLAILLLLVVPFMLHYAMLLIYSMV